MEKIRPYFDIELFLQTAGETRLGGSEMNEALALWEEWSAHLSCATIKDGDKTYLALWLSPEVETAVATAWDNSPSHGFRLNALAQTLLMCATHTIIPEVADVGCAPFPHASPSLAAALAEAGLPARAGTGLEFGRKFAVVTRRPFGGGCEICSLLPSCPRGGVGGAFIDLG